MIPDHSFSYMIEPQPLIRGQTHPYYSNTSLLFKHILIIQTHPYYSNMPSEWRLNLRPLHGVVLGDCENVGLLSLYVEPISLLHQTNSAATNSFHFILNSYVTHIYTQGYEEVWGVERYSSTHSYLDNTLR